MVNYDEGKIYKLTSNQTNNIYIGSTTKKYLCDRLSHHKYLFKNKLDNMSSFEILKYGDCKIILIENYPCNSKDELHAREQYWTDQNKDICVNKQKAFQTKEERRKYLLNFCKLYYKNNRKYFKDLRSKRYTCLYCDLELCIGARDRHNKSNYHKENVEYFDNILNS